MKLRKIAALAACIAVSLSPAMTGCSRIEEHVEEIVIFPTVSSPSDSLPLDTQENVTIVTDADPVTDDFSRYIYDQLSDQEKKYYNIIADAARDFESTAVFPEPLSPELMRKLFIAVYNQEEDIFWMDSMFYRPAADSESLAISYRFDKDTTAAMRSELERRTNEIFALIPPDADDYTKLKTFHDYIVLHCTFSQDAPYVNTVYGTLVDGYAQCEGYAFAFDYLCRKAGIDCFTVTGTNNQGGSHAWNSVRLDGSWYNVDCTWDDPIIDPPDTNYIRHYFFLVPDSDIIGLTHIPDNTYFMYPICSGSQNYYIREGLYYTGSGDIVTLMSEAAVNAVNSGRKNVAVRFADKSDYDKAVSKIFDGKKIKDILNSVNTNTPYRVNTGRFIRHCNDDQLIIHLTLIFEE